MRTLFSDSKLRASFLDFSGTGNIKLNGGYEFWFTYALQLLVILKSCPATSKTFAVKLWLSVSSGRSNPFVKPWYDSVNAKEMNPYSFLPL